MESSDYDREGVLKVKRQQQAAASPRADQRGGGGLLSAIGNAGVQRLLRAARLQRQGKGGETVEDEVGRAIQAKRGTGQSLDESSRRDLEPALGADFSDVRVHTDSEADRLNRAVSAEAFTTGRDIFFRSGSYSPGSPDGKKLLAHELTHVVQQQGAPPAGDLTVSSPEDASERQASAVADSLGSAGPTAAASVSRAEAPEDDEEMAMSRIDKAAMPEEEEEPPLAPSLARAEPEEEELPAS